MYELHPNQITQWKNQLKEQSASVFKEPSNGKDENDKLIEQLYKTIGELTMDVDFLKKAVSLSVQERRSVKYEHIYIHSHETCQELWRELTEYFDFYNHQRPHQSLDYQPPVKIYRDKIAA